MTPSGDWRIFLIGGSSGTGKTYAARELVRRLAIPCLMADDVRIAIQGATTPAQHPDLHVFLEYRPEQWRQPEAIVEDWLRVGRAMMKPLREIMAHHIVVEGAGRLIIEGDGILPSLATQSAFSDLPRFETIDIRRKVRSVFLVDDHENRILDNLDERGNRGTGDVDREAQIAFARAARLFGERLASAARECRVPVLSPRPRETLVERLLGVLAPA